MAPVRTFYHLEPFVICWCRLNRQIPGREGDKSTTPVDQKLVERSKIGTFRILVYNIVVVKSLAKVYGRSAS